MSAKPRDLGMTPLDDLFSTDESRAEAQLEKVVTLNPADISDFPNLDCFDYLPGVQNDYDLGYYWIEESGCYDTSSLGALANYNDYESFGRDIRYEEGGVFGDNGYVRSNGGRFVDIYDGDIENIPDEYRVSSPALPVRSAVTRQTEQPER